MFEHASSIDNEIYIIIKPNAANFISLLILTTFKVEMRICTSHILTDNM